MMWFLSRFLAFQTVRFATREFKGAIAPLAPYLRRLGLGVSLVLSSLLAWGAALFFLLLSLFFRLGDSAGFEALIGPAVTTGLISLAFGIILIFFGFNLLRRPR